MSVAVLAQQRHARHQPRGPGWRLDGRHWLGRHVVAAWYTVGAEVVSFGTPAMPAGAPTERDAGDWFGADLNGSSDYFDVPGIAGAVDPIPAGSLDFCVLTLVVPDSVSGQDTRFVSKDFGTGEQDHDLMVGEAGGSNVFRSRVRLNGFTFTTLSPSSVLLGEPNLVIGGASSAGMVGATVAYISKLNSNGWNHTGYPASTAGGYSPQSGSTMKIGRSAAVSANFVDGVHVCTLLVDGMYPDEDQARAFFADPFCVFVRRHPILFSTAPDSPEILLDGAANATATAAGTLQTEIRLDADGLASGSAAGDLVTEIHLTAAAAVTATAAATLQTEIRLDTDGVTSGSAAGELVTEILLEADAAASAIGAGDLVTEIRLDTDVITSGNAAYELVTEIVLVSACTASGTAVGELAGTVVVLDADCMATGGASGDMRTGANLDTACAAAASAAAVLQTSLLLNADCAGVATAAGDLATGVVLDTDCAASTTAAATLQTEIRLLGAADVLASVAGSLVTELWLDAAAVAAAVGAASLATEIRLDSVAVTAAVAAGDLQTGLGLGPVEDLRIVSITPRRGHASATAQRSLRPI